jgi:hypothetical protein
MQSEKNSKLAHSCTNVRCEDERVNDLIINRNVTCHK